jgi:hypothetical protein
LGKTQFALHELLSARRHSGPDENETIKTFIKTTKEFSNALSAVASNDRIKDAFDDVLRRMIFSFFAVWIKKHPMSAKFPPHLPRDLMSFLEGVPAGAILQLLATAIADIVTPMATTLSGATRIRNAAEYKFVSDVASFWFAITHEFPTLSRNTQNAKNSSRAQPLKPPSPTHFQQYIEAAVPSPAIHHETVRGAVDELRVRKGIKNMKSRAK